MEKTFICVIDFLSIEIKWGDAMSAKMLVALVCLGQFNRIHFHQLSLYSYFSYKHRKCLINTMIDWDAMESEPHCSMS